jgi:hypothetical protein
MATLFWTVLVMWGGSVVSFMLIALWDTEANPFYVMRRASVRTVMRLLRFGARVIGLTPADRGSSDLIPEAWSGPFKRAGDADLLAEAWMLERRDPKRTVNLHPERRATDQSEDAEKDATPEAPSGEPSADATK